MAIIGTLPNNIQNGQAVDANPVMADFNFIVNQVNANANPLGTLTAPSGTAMPFQQASAPLGWVAQTGAAFSDSVLHVVTPSTFVGTSGANTVTQFLQSTWVTGGTAITAAQMPIHNHVINIGDPGHVHGLTDPGHTHNVHRDSNSGVAGSLDVLNGQSVFSDIPALTTSTTGISMGAAATGISATSNNAGSGATHNHSNTFNMQFVDHIVAVKT